MKANLLSTLLFLPAMLSAEPALIMQLIGCEEPAIVSRDALDQAAALPEALKKLEALRKQPEPDRDAVAKLEKTIEDGRVINQEIVWKLRFTNTGREPVQLPFGPDTSQIHLALEGPGAVDLPYTGMMTREFRQPNPTVIVPGAFREFPIEGLAYGPRNLSRWLVSKTGTYRARLRFTTTIDGKQIEFTCNNFFHVTHPPTMTVMATEDHPDEVLAVTGSQESAVLDIESLGRGGAVLHPGAAGWPEYLVFRLHFVYLQEFSISNQRTGATATTSVASWDTVPISVVCTVKKAEECTVATRIVTPDGVPARVPMKEGYFEIQLEPKELAADNGPLSISWLDHPPG